MHARITAVTAQKDTLHEVTRIYRDSFLPALSGQKGFLGGYLLTDPDTGEGASITMWESEADGKAYENSGLYKEQVDKLRPFFTNPPSLKSYTVAAHAAAPERARR